MINGMILVLVFGWVLNYRFTALQLPIYKGDAMRDMCFRWPHGNIVYPIFETTLILCSVFFEENKSSTFLKYAPSQP